MQNNATHRWNIEPLPDGRLKVCRGEHGSGQDCEWEYFVPEAALAAAPAVAVIDNDAGAKVIAMTDIVEQLRHPYTDREEIMRSWDAIREYLLDGKLGTYARDIFESVLSNIDWEREQAADEIDRLNAECTASMTEIGNLRSALATAEAEIERLADKAIVGEYMWTPEELGEAVAAARKEAIEECAAWHNHCSESLGDMDPKYAEWHSANAVAIRALAENTGGKP